MWVKITGFGEVGFRVNVNITTTLLRPTADQISLAKILQGYKANLNLSNLNLSRLI